MIENEKQGKTLETLARPQRAFVGTASDFHVIVGTVKPGSTVMEEGRTLPARQDVVNHSPDGFAWGYEGSGPAQLALAILVEVIGAAKALAYYQSFKRACVAKLSRYQSFILYEDQIWEILRGLEGWIE